MTPPAHGVHGEEDSGRLLLTKTEPRPPAHGVNSCVPLDLESHFGPVWREWLYRIAPNIFETLKP